MFAEGQLLRFDPFLFKNSAPSKPKFYVVLKHMDSTGGLMCVKQSPLIKRRFLKLL